MRLNPDVVQTLREMFEQGATPSRLFRYLHECHPDRSGWRGLVQAYFREAFAIPMVRVSSNPEDYLSGDHAHLNRNLIHAMVLEKSRWRSVDRPPEGATRSWLDSLTATTDENLIQQVCPGSVPELAASWERMDASAQQYVRQLMANLNALDERVEILANLAESLQRQVEAGDGIRQLHS